jgi:surfeit locus 1 family protein
VIRRLPVIPTIVVLVAAAIMVRLGFWQLDRLGEKEELIARYEAALEGSDARPFLADADGAFSDDDLFHPTTFECIRVLSRESISGRNAGGQAGFAHIVRCGTDWGVADVKLGWSRDPQGPEWYGGEVSGLIVPGGADGARVQMNEPVAGLEPLARPDPRDLPNNHMAYAVQWFLFALVALVIYGLAIRKRLKEQA